MRIVLYLVLAACLIAAGYSGMPIIARTGVPPPPVVTFTGPTRERLESLQELVIQKVAVTDILTYSEGTVSAAWLVRGDGLIAVSLHDAVVAEIDAGRRSARIQLPGPRLLSARVDHERTVFWDVRQSLWNRLNPWGVRLPDVETQAMRAAQQLVEQAVDSPEHHHEARALTAALIKNLYGALGWTVSVDWQDPDDGTRSQPTL